jgi:hypothetical protein
MIIKIFITKLNEVDFVNESIFIPPPPVLRNNFLRDPAMAKLGGLTDESDCVERAPDISRV